MPFFKSIYLSIIGLFVHFVLSSNPNTSLVSNFVPNTGDNITFTINNPLTNQVQRLVGRGDHHRPNTYDNLYQFYGSRQASRQYTTSGRNVPAAFQHHQLVSSILCQPGYTAMPSPTKHVVVGGSSMQAPMQYVNVPVPVSMVEPSSSQRTMLLTNRVQAAAAGAMAWPQSGRPVALVPSWQNAAPHSALIVDSAPFLNMEDIYPKHHLNLPPRHEPKKDSPMHHLV